MQNRQFADEQARTQIQREGLDLNKSRFVFEQQQAKLMNSLNQLNAFSQQVTARQALVNNLPLQEAEWKRQGMTPDQINQARAAMIATRDQAMQAYEGMFQQHLATYQPAVALASDQISMGNWLKQIEASSTLPIGKQLGMISTLDKELERNHPYMPTTPGGEAFYQGVKAKLAELRGPIQQEAEGIIQGRPGQGRQQTAGSLFAPPDFSHLAGVGNQVNQFFGQPPANLPTQSWTGSSLGELGNKFNTYFGNAGTREDYFRNRAAVYQQKATAAPKTPASCGCIA